MAIDLWGLPPWEQLPYFTFVKETIIVGPNAHAPICTPNNERVGLIISLTQTGSSIFISTSPNAASQQGILIAANAAYKDFWAWSEGLLPTLAWYANTPQNLTVLEIILSGWPREGQSYMSSIEHPTYATPPTVLGTNPGVKGDQGVASYWRSIVDKIRGK